MAPEIIPETRGRSPLPEGKRKKMISFRISPEAIQQLDDYIRRCRANGTKMTKASALEKAISYLSEK